MILDKSIIELTFLRLVYVSLDVAPPIVQLFSKEISLDYGNSEPGEPLLEHKRSH